MTVGGTGIDSITIARVSDVLTRHGERFLRRVYTPREVDYCGGRVPELAARFAGKEAVMKALGTGARGVGWREIEILANGRGKPLVLLHGRALARANQLRLSGVEISLTHEGGTAAAIAIANAEAPSRLLPGEERSA